MDPRRPGIWRHGHTVVIYPGHEGGQIAADAVLSWARAVPVHRARVVYQQIVNTRKTAPMLLAIATRARESHSV